ncbi:hypothetical protein GTE6_42 [Gordonia phage GTE6]|uniref:Uncharacterized protein n=1 Tax=Gordonia phage GTE6 TaxID=1647474 RepID=A0A0K0MWX3_9CAUD|nr:hypothetical protein AU100_gp42 [Gordonia phage GTE6]AKI28684.1 hypothetical protein GTE6_42 [Gordonia phage GTE6]
MTENTTTTTTAPQTNRPEDLADLDTIYDGRTAHPLIDVHDLGRIAKIPGALSALGDLLDKLNTEVEYNDAPDDVKIKSDLNTVAVTQELDDDEVAKLIAARQASYDRGRELWQKYLDDGSLPTGSYIWDYYLHREKITDAPKVTR